MKEKQNKTVLITGANSGIGKEASLLFAKNGFTVIMACRSLDKSKKVREEIISASENENVHLLKVDMSSIESIKNFCVEYKSNFEKLDILIHNAAYFNHGEKYRLSEDDIEIAFATNVVGPFLMTNLLLDQLKKSDSPVILNVSSNIIKHFFSPKKVIDFENIVRSNNQEKPSVYVRYRNSKMAFLMLTFKMAEEYKHYNVRVFSLQVNGAKMSKDTLRKMKMNWRLIAYIQNLFFPDPGFMAKNYFDICTSEKFCGFTEKHFNHKLEIMGVANKKTGFQEAMGSSVYPFYADRKELQNKVWDICNELTKGYLEE